MQENSERPAKMGSWKLWCTSWTAVEIPVIDSPWPKPCQRPPPSGGKMPKFLIYQGSKLLSHHRYRKTPLNHIFLCFNASLCIIAPIVDRLGTKMSNWTLKCSFCKSGEKLKIFWGFWLLNTSIRNGIEMQFWCILLQNCYKIFQTF